MDMTNFLTKYKFRYIGAALYKHSINLLSNLQNKQTNMLPPI